MVGEYRKGVVGERAPTGSSGDCHLQGDDGDRRVLFEPSLAKKKSTCISVACTRCTSTVCSKAARPAM